MNKTLVAVKEPKMSLKMLCEYDDASSITRTSIIRDSKFNKPFISARYNEAESFISEFLSKTIDYPEMLIERAIQLEKIKSKAYRYEKGSGFIISMCIESFS